MARRNPFLCLESAPCTIDVHRAIGTCFYKHPPEAKGTPKPPQAKPTPAELAARAAAWRALNQTAQNDILHASRHPTDCSSSQVICASGNESFSAPPARLSSESEPALASPAVITAWDQAALQIAQACDRRQPGGFEEEAEADQPSGKAASSGGLVAGTAQSGVRAIPSLAALHAASNAARAVQNRGPGKRNKVKNRFRAGVFRRFLLDTYGRQLLSSGSGVLDIAGGKGELAFELVNLNNIPATVVEPRALKLAKQELWLKAGFYHRNSIFQRYIDVPLTALLDAGVVTPPQLRMVVSETISACIAAADASSSTTPADFSYYLGADTSNAEVSRSPDADIGDAAAADLTRSGGADVSNSAESARLGNRAEAAADFMPSRSTAGTQQDEARGFEDMGKGEAGRICDRSSLHAMLEESFQLALDTRWTHKGLEHEGGSSSSAALQEEDSDADEETEAFPAASNGCTFPEAAAQADHATEAIVDFAQRMRKPFAVVPCCVYAAEFPRRRLPDGAPVRTNEDLIAYIVSKDPAAIKVRELPFEGRNKVVYVTEWTSSSSSPSLP
ncbi:g10151 [Coccomyxa elongata]